MVKFEKDLAVYKDELKNLEKIFRTSVFAKKRSQKSLLEEAKKQVVGDANKRILTQAKKAHTDVKKIAKTVHFTPYE